MEISFRPVSYEDFEFVTLVYNHYVANSTATFRTNLISTGEVHSILPVNHPRYNSYIIDFKGESIGYCAIGQFRNKEAYDRTAEVLVYLKPEYTKRGIGPQALAFLEDVAKSIQVHVLIGYITAENEGSVKLFQQCAYKKCALLEEVGEKFGRILDVVIYQKKL